MLNDYDALVKIATEAAIPADVQSSYNFLHDKIAA